LYWMDNFNFLEGWSFEAKILVLYMDVDQNNEIDYTLSIFILFGFLICYYLITNLSERH
jgi:hypothetical protein